MGRRARALTVVVALTLAVPGPAAGSDDPDVARQELGTARQELGTAQRELEELERTVRRTTDEIAALDVRLRDAATELAHVQEELARAEERFATALAVERRTAAELVAADGELVGLLDDWDAQRRRLEDRAVHAYKHGGTRTSQLLIGGLVGAADWHEVAVTIETVGRLVADDRALADGTASLTRRTAGLRAEVGDTRREAANAARTAARERRQVERLLARQQALIASVEDERAHRQAVLAELEADAEARAVLVGQLVRRVTDLQLAAIPVLVAVDLDLDLDGPPPAWAAGLPGGAAALAPAIEAVAARHGLDGRLLAALVWAESGFRVDAVSHRGATGLTQLMPGTARGLRVDPRDPIQNLDGGARYLRVQLDRFGSVDLALAAYNAGPGRVAAADGIPNIVETQVYVVRVVELYARLAGL
jgi:soluble lytic murein transglycosylase-like protein